MYLVLHYLVLLSWCALLTPVPKCYLSIFLKFATGLFTHLAIVMVDSFYTACLWQSLKFMMERQNKPSVRTSFLKLSKICPQLSAPGNPVYVVIQKCSCYHAPWSPKPLHSYICSAEQSSFSWKFSLLKLFWAPEATVIHCLETISKPSHQSFTQVMWLFLTDVGHTFVQELHSITSFSLDLLPQLFFAYLCLCWHFKYEFASMHKLES